LSSSSTVAVTPLVTHPYPAGTASTSTLAVTGAQTIAATVGIGSSSTLAVTVTVVRTSPVAIGSTSALAVTGAATIPGVVPIGSTSTLQVSVQGIQNATVAFAGTSTLTVVGALTITTTITVGSTSTLAVVAAVTHPAGIGLASTSSLVVVGVLTQPGAVPFTGSSSVSLTATLVHAAAVLIAGTSQLSAAGQVSPNIVIAGASTFTAGGVQLVFALIVIDGGGGLALIPTIEPLHPPYTPPTPKRGGRIRLGGPRMVTLTPDAAHHADLSVVLGSRHTILLDGDLRTESEVPVADQLLVRFTIRSRTRTGYDDDGNPVYAWDDLLDQIALKWETRTEIRDGVTYRAGTLLIGNPDDVTVTEDAIAVDESSREAWRILSVADLPGTTRLTMERVD